MTDAPTLPEFMTWEQLDDLPEEIAGEIELWNGRVVRIRHAPGEHQQATNLLWLALREAVKGRPDTSPCLAVHAETNVFFGSANKNDFSTPDFMVHCCVEEFGDVHTDDVLIAGEVLSKSNTPGIVEAKRARYSNAGIPWYWEVTLAPQPARINSIRVFALETSAGDLPGGVRPLRPANYLLVQEWLPETAIEFDHPFPIRINWESLRL